MKNIYVLRLIPVLIFLALTVMNGCVPIPTPSHDGVGAITEETVESLKPGKSTRADVLHLLGDPAYVVEQDRFFVYWWKQTEGYVIFLFPMGSPGFAVSGFHHLLVEFTPDNRLERLEFIKDLPYRDMLNETLDQWTKQRD